ncbi:MAG: hypothetical protein IKB58_01085 [Oscillospiraceae bacterium]|nr:hypothetical protein [Oscillospiraceae bacterium]MBR2928505.1 hypothetical protein [Oscillospiraceae bacterium]MBR6678359.1 hypothetical protein [Oscillospiraceae bacterium]
MYRKIFHPVEEVAPLRVQSVSAPHFLFLWLVKEKENAPLAVEKKKKTPPCASVA